MTSQQNKARKPLAGLIILTLLATGAFAVLMSLGFWQVQRLAWKNDLIETVTARPDLAPVPAPGPDLWKEFDFDYFDYRPVSLTGRFLDDEVHVYTVLNKPRGQARGQGYWIMAPFRTDDGWTAIVNRGFVPEELKEVSDRPASAAGTDSVTVTGLVRRAGKANPFTPENDLERNIWFVRDPGAIGTSFGLDLGSVAPYSVDLSARYTPEEGLPQAGETLLTFPNNHLQYAVTWFGLAAALVGVFVAFMVSRLRRYRETEPDRV